MKLLAPVFLFVVCFLAALLGMMAFTGNLSSEKLGKLWKKNPPADSATAAQAPSPEPPDDLDPIVKALNQREEELNKREARVQEEEARLKLVNQELDQLREELKQTLQEVQTSVTSADQDREKRLTDVAKSLENMKPDSAAKALEGWPPQDAAAILRLIKDKDRGKILDKMEAQKATDVLLALQERKL
ncbi:MAG: hypothetical protein HY706_09190 [Candidatus Hydrogenedentes bacterium]|nr:hypothetical protein [Candidatus Hydrogenedentota bacterium]